MNRKIVEGMLENYISNEIEIDNIKLEIETIIDRDITACGFEERTSQTYKINNTVEQLVIKKEKEINELNKRKTILERENKKVDNAMRSLADFERKIIEYKYFKRKGTSLKDIANELNLSYSWANKLKERAIKNMCISMSINKRAI